MFSSSCEASPYGGAKAASKAPHTKAPKKITLTQIKKLHREGDKITMMTCYDAMTAGIAEECGVDLLLVLHTQAVRRGLVHNRPMIIGDMPFGSFLTVEDGVRNGARFIKEAGADIVKLEVTKFSTELIRRMTAAGIGVVGHIGLTPQSYVQMGGYRIQGKAASAACHLIDFAKQLEAAGCVMLVLECVPGEVGKLITEAINIPTIGIGSGPDTSGQVLVVHDLLGLTPKAPKLAKAFVNTRELMNIGVSRLSGNIFS
ncbi:3-methyl-2-oxobutanoate hydroxymethyltransferase, putative [Perkinsus marinus ATCC 50983]|uniref:3-methyl-2-oxobutanoate hydroxymethyltransferase n=1 Tax=Perkinsus marinus (strain ATCC 50983 / TXsc) TaxID=423536 RepID=C5L449_PERM5|nr:3-methyl-2-oxobutanoate hydroxymethyltransferase, putative [Perkinsus marinus ATCC 50983]EER08515.1 3-methyl-2-oxobutanoate hydroxymethyltransferase, putative [Perkinsus marinus ATCC 50983]|eukprot:XP_002776699.1 3-methyl-2-oxobutanoate hydroxymethyltransferase, putative [Perkinsus marinus ATCC 50983]